LELRFFGLTAESKHYILEYIYLLIRHLGFTYKDAYNLPVWKRDWFVKKFIEEKEKAQERQAPPPSNNAAVNSSSRRLFRQ